ncbi:hypothetical protein RZS08_10665, partial [Arthrospira platensis SPKY1]|nr:hypothetical protein [Arthrospira platensis SPKY1]
GCINTFFVMIKNAELQSPRISFALGKIVKQASVGDLVPIFQHRQYRDGYTMNGQPFTGHFLYECESAGTFGIRAIVSTPNGEELISNEITLIVT